MQKLWKEDAIDGESETSDEFSLLQSVQFVAPLANDTHGEQAIAFL